MLGVQDTNTSVMSAVSTAVVTTQHSNASPTPFVRYKRADSSSSASSTSSSDSSKCTGSKQTCQKPADHDMSVTVGVAVAVPIVVIFLFLGIILYFVYRRGKKEALEDNDPDFDGDEYINGAYPVHMMQQFHQPQQPQQQQQQQNYYYSSESPQEVNEDFKNAYSQVRPPLSNPFNNGSYRSSRVGSGWEVNPFHIPDSGDANSLRNFAKEIQMDGNVGYNLASKSRNASHTSLELTASSSSLHKSANFGQTYPTNRDTMTSYSQASNAGKVDGNSLRYSSVPAESQQFFEKEISSTNNDEDFEFEVHNEPNEPNENKSTSAYEETAQINSNGFQTKQVSIGNLPRDKVDDETLSPAEAENIRRMKSIYKVYLDRNDTMRQANLGGEQDINEQLDDNTTPNPTEILPTENSVVNNEPEILHEYVDSHLTNEESANQSISHDNMHGNTGNTLGVPAEGNTNRDTRYRAASSLYSEVPQALAGGHRYNQQYPQQGYNMPQNSYNPLQHNHPQTLESIGELPTPAQFGFNSTSSHSLTSFRQPSKQQFPMQAVRLNGTAVNPMDHPEMFYSQSEEALISPGQYGNDMVSLATNTTQNSSLFPHQMRSSIVMTDPSQFQNNALYKPAGSFRKYNDSSSRNNSFTSQGNTYQQHMQQQMNSRVSGILEESDVVQPPTIPSILPHSGSQDDLRKQIGSGHDFNVV